MWSSLPNPPLRFCNRRVVNAGAPFPHQAGIVEFPKLVSIRPVPLAFFVVPFILKAGRDAIFAEAQQRLLEFILAQTFHPEASFLSLFRQVRPVSRVSQVRPSVTQRFGRESGSNKELKLDRGGPWRGTDRMMQGIAFPASYRRQR